MKSGVMSCLLLLSIPCNVLASQNLRHFMVRVWTVFVLLALMVCFTGLQLFLKRLAAFILLKVLQSVSVQSFLHSVWSWILCLKRKTCYTVISRCLFLLLGVSAGESYWLKCFHWGHFFFSLTHTSIQCDQKRVVLPSVKGHFAPFFTLCNMRKLNNWNTTLLKEKYVSHFVLLGWQHIKFLLKFSICKQGAFSRVAPPSV